MRDNLKQKNSSRVTEREGKSLIRIETFEEIKKKKKKKNKFGEKKKKNYQTAIIRSSVGRGGERERKRVHFKIVGASEGRVSLPDF